MPTANGESGGKRLKKSWILKQGSMDVTFLFFVLILLGIGLIMLFSASYAYAETKFGDSYKFIIRQSGFAVAGVVLMLVISRIDYHKYMKYSWLIYGVSIALLILVYLLPSVEGYHRWIILGPINFQPSEIA